MLKINEVFYSIQGESTFAGFATTFIRTTGCNLRCTYCDTKYSYDEGENWTLDKIYDTVEAFGARYVCITGGEPLLQKPIYEFMSTLCDRKYKVSLETSGSKLIHEVDSRVKIVLDIKTPDSGAANSFKLENLNKINLHTEIKFVICSESDFKWAELFCGQHDLFEKATVLYSPSFGCVAESWLAEKILKTKSNARLQLQQHKYIWNSNMRGV